jgi:uncharacterized protein with PIN domain
MMDPITLYFHGDLDFFLAPDHKGRPVVYPLEEQAAVKHPVESLGVPHTEVETLVMDERGVGFDYLLRGGETVHVYPWNDPPPPDLLLALRPPPPRPLRFVIDTHLGKLAAYLRMLGFDACYRNDYDDATLAAIAAAETRVLLTRDRGLLKRKQVVYGYCPRETDPRGQFVSVLRRYRLAGDIHPWRRCVHCNGLLAPVDKALILDRLEPKTRLYYDEFQQCQSCGQIYWRGSHFERMEAFIEGVRREIEKLESG